MKFGAFRNLPYTPIVGAAIVIALLVSVGCEPIRRFSFRDSFGANDLDTPAGICCGNIDKNVDAIAVADRAGDHILLWQYYYGPNDAHFIRSIGKAGSGPGELHAPNDVAIAFFQIFVADSKNNRIQVFSPDGSFIRSFGTVGSGDGELNTPLGVDVSLDGRVFVADSGNHRISVFDTSGNFVANWGSFGSGPLEFRDPRDVAVCSGNAFGKTGQVLAVCDYGNDRVQVIDLNAVVIRTFPDIPNPAGLCDGEWSPDDGWSRLPAVNVVSPVTNTIYSLGGKVFSQQIKGPPAPCDVAYDGLDLFVTDRNLGLVLHYGWD